MQAVKPNETYCKTLNWSSPWGCISSCVSVITSVDLKGGHTHCLWMCVRLVRPAGKRKTTVLTLQKNMLVWFQEGHLTCFCVGVCACVRACVRVCVSCSILWPEKKMARSMCSLPSLQLPVRLIWLQIWSFSWFPLKSHWQQRCCSVGKIGNGNSKLRHNILLYKNSTNNYIVYIMNTITCSPGGLIFLQFVSYYFPPLSVCPLWLRPTDLIFYCSNWSSDAHLIMWCVCVFVRAVSGC